ncbi:MAG: isochorismatase hydrolase [Chitinophagaceae bacterium]|nr:isochorismatase hydrolase [Chitinophagaceae bacterium]
MNDLLLVVDMQNGFINEKSNFIIPVVKELIELFQQKNKLVAFTRFINHPNSEYRRWINFTRLSIEPEIDIIKELEGLPKNIFDKNHYTPFTNEFKNFLIEKEVNQIFICGVATDSCVMKSAIDSFEAGIHPIVIKDACYSHAGEEAHTAGLLVISRNIGRSQVKSLSEIKDIIDQ